MSYLKFAIGLDFTRGSRLRVFSDSGESKGCWNHTMIDSAISCFISQ